MPRTKVVKKRRVTSESTINETVNVSQPRKKDLNEKITEVKEEIKSSVDQVQLEYDKYVIEIKQFFEEIKSRLHEVGLSNKTLRELRDTGYLKSDNQKVDVSKSVSKEVLFAKPKSAARVLRKRSNSCSSRSSKATCMTRSASCERPTRNISGSASKMRTPLNRNIPTFPVVTPKVNPNQPVSVLRRPRQGEFALSMSGSPLMVSGVTVDDMVSVTVPMADGRVLSILPTDGIDSANLSLDEVTRMQLVKLRSNLTKCLQMKH